MDLVELLVANGADVNQRAVFDGSTALHMASVRFIGSYYNNNILEVF